MGKSPLDEYNEGKLSALIEVVMAVARHTMAPEEFRAAALAALELLEARALNTNASDNYILGIQTLRQWMDEQSRKQPGDQPPAVQTQQN